VFVELTKDFMGHKAGQRIAVADSDRDDLIKSGIAKPFSDDPITPLIAKGLESALAGFTRGLDGIIAQTLKQFADAQRRSRRGAEPIIFGEDGHGDPKGKTLGDWLLAVARNDRGYLEKHYGSTFVEWRQKAAMAESSGTTGGYTVPPDFYQGIMALIAEQSIIRSRAFVMPMASATLQIPFLDISTVQAAGISPFFAVSQFERAAHEVSGGAADHFVRGSLKLTHYRLFFQVEVLLTCSGGDIVAQFGFLDVTVLGRKLFLQLAPCRSLALDLLTDDRPFDDDLHLAGRHIGHVVVAVPDLAAGRLAFAVKGNKGDIPVFDRGAVVLDRAADLALARTSTTGDDQRERGGTNGPRCACASHDHPPMVRSWCSPRCRSWCRAPARRSAGCCW
jgi:hypothetical protein